MVDWTKVMAVSALITAIASIIMAGTSLVQIYHISQQQKIIIKEVDELKGKIADINKIINVSEIEGLQCPEGYKKATIIADGRIMFVCVPKNQSLVNK